MIKQNARKINAFFYTGFRARKVTTLYYRLIKNLPIFFFKIRKIELKIPKTRVS